MNEGGKQNDATSNCRIVEPKLKDEGNLKCMPKSFKKKWASLHFFTKMNQERTNLLMIALSIHNEGMTG